MGLAQVNVDSLFEVGKQKSYDEQYDIALPLFDKIISETPDYYDAYLFRARILAWKGDYDKSLNYLQVVKDSFPTEIMPRVFEATVLFWKEEYDSCLAQCNSVLADSAVEQTRYLKARVLYFKKEYKEALEVVEPLCEDYPDNKDYEQLRWTLVNLLSEDHVGIWGSYDHFTNFPDNPRVGLSAEVKKVFKNSPVIGRVNLARRFGLDDYQVEFEAYPRPSNNLYFFLNASYSPKGIWFPFWRLSGDIYFGLPKAVELSMGLRYLEFSTITFNMLTFYAGYYPGNNYIFARYYVGISNLGSANIFEVVGRRYLSTQYHYVELRAGYGNSPDVNNLINVATDFNSFTGQVEDAYNLSLAYQQPLIDRWHAKAWVAYSRQLPQTIADYSIISGNLGVWWRF